MIQLRKAGQSRYYHTLIVHTSGADPIMTAHTVNRKQRLSRWTGFAGSVKIKTGYFD